MLCWLSMLLLTACPPYDASYDRACAEPYSCPAENVVDCSTQIDDQAHYDICHGSCGLWVREYCDVDFVY